jgi:hypothetical protein
MPNEQNDRVLELKQRRLQKLKEEQAIKGISTSPEVLIEMEELEAEIRQLQATSHNHEFQPTVSPPVATPPDRQQKALPTPPSAQPTLEEKSGSKWWVLVVVILVGLAGYVLVSMWNPSPEPQPGEFIHAIRVISPMGEPLPDAHVVIQPSERDHIEQWTDGEGIASFFLDGSFDGVPAMVFVVREGFRERKHEIMLHPEGYDEIPLEPVEP